MRASILQAIEKAMLSLSKRNVFKLDNHEFEVRTLFPVKFWRPHTRPCSKDNSLIIAEDSCGNFFLYLPNGSVSFWDHETEKETILVPTVEEFCDSLIEPTPVVLKSGQVKSRWIDPTFLEDLKKNEDS